MANPPCATGDGNAASFIGTYLETGDTVALCDECMVAWSAAMLNSMTGIDPTPFLQAISEGDPTPPEGSDDEGAGEHSATPAPSDPSPANGDGGRSPRASRGRGTVDARSDEERATSTPNPDTPGA